MEFQEFVENQVFSPSLVATALPTKTEIADTLGLCQSSIESQAIPVPTWRPMPGFAQSTCRASMTPDQLVREGKADDVHAHLDRIMAGGYA